MKHFNHFYLKFSFALMFIFIASNIHAQIVYVTPSGNGNQSGSSWANALPGAQLPAAINNAASGSQIWVAGELINLQPVPTATFLSIFILR